MLIMSACVAAISARVLERVRSAPRRRRSMAIWASPTVSALEYARNARRIKAAGQRRQATCDIRAAR
jgi:hypothetical protein